MPRGGAYPRDGRERVKGWTESVAKHENCIIFGRFQPFNRRGVDRVPASIEDLRSVINDRYVVEREIGRGGMAIVYLGRDLRDQRPVAIKVLSTDVSVVLGAARF